MCERFREGSLRSGVHQGVRDRMTVRRSEPDPQLGNRPGVEPNTAQPQVDHDDLGRRALRPAPQIECAYARTHAASQVQEIGKLGIVREADAPRDKPALLRGDRHEVDGGLTPDLGEDQRRLSDMDDPEDLHSPGGRAARDPHAARNLGYNGLITDWHTVNVGVVPQDAQRPHRTLSWPAVVPFGRGSGA